jgi:GNAT superfamily N-acetyltransferase
MDAAIRPLRETDRPAVARLLDDTVGAGFWRFAGDAHALSFVAVSGAGEEVAGVLLACLEPADDPDPRAALRGPSGSAAGTGGLVLHVRQLAVAPAARRTGIASRLLARAEAEALARGAGAAFAFGWLPSGRPEPDAVPFWVAAGYAARPDIPGFYAEGSLATGALCPYCGEPPCHCAARPFVKALAPG